MIQTPICIWWAGIFLTLIFEPKTQWHCFAWAYASLAWFFTKMVYLPLKCQLSIRYLKYTLWAWICQILNWPLCKPHPDFTCTEENPQLVCPLGRHGPTLLHTLNSHLSIWDRNLVSKIPLVLSRSEIRPRKSSPRLVKSIRMLRTISPKYMPLIIFSNLQCGWHA